MGGSYRPENVHPLCRECHIEKTEIEHDMSRLADFSRLARWLELALPEHSPIEALAYVKCLAICSCYD